MGNMYYRNKLKWDIHYCLKNEEKLKMLTTLVLELT